MLSALIFSGPFDLDWNVTWKTGVPYEVGIDHTKIEEASLQVFADGIPLETLRLEDPHQVNSVYRFSVPEGTRRLKMAPGKSKRESSSEVDNIFAGGRWSTNSATKAGPGSVEGSLLIESVQWKPGEARYSAEVPERCEGVPVSIEIDCESRTKMVWPLKIYIEQYDSSGNLLPEYVSDPRWTSHLRPYGVLTPFREYGRIHPRAARLEMVFSFLASVPEFDDYGLPLGDKEDARPKLLVTRLAMRPAAKLPFPKYDDSWFGGGVSDTEGDCSLSLDGQRAFWFATHSQAVWAQGYEETEESNIFYPCGAATVELWLKPDWTWADKNKTFFIFQAANHNTGCDLPEKVYSSRGDLLSLSYRPAEKKATLCVQDAYRHKYSGEFSIALPQEEWTHYAVTVEPGGKAQVFVNGKSVFKLDIPQFIAYNLSESINPDDGYVVDFFLGGPYMEARTISEIKRRANGITYLKADVDALRITSGALYSSDFTPSRRPEADSGTRALFNFDRSFDGESGGGIGWISGSVFGMTDIISHLLGDFQYFPSELVETNDPAKQMFGRVEEIPSEQDFVSSEKITRFSLNLSPGESASFTLPQEEIFTDYVEIENTGRGVLKYPAVLKKGDIDARSFGDIRESLFEQESTDRERVNRFFNYLLKASDYFVSYSAKFDPGSDRPYLVQYHPLDVINSYCGFDCGPLNNAAATIFANSARCAANGTEGYAHAFEEVFYDGQNHIYDLSAQKFFPAMDNETAAGLREADVQEGVIRRQGASGDHFTRMGKRSFYNNDVVYPEKFAISLNPGERFRIWSMNDGMVNDLCMHVHTTIRKKLHKDNWLNYNSVCHASGAGPMESIFRVDRFYPEYGNGFLLFDGKPDESNPAFTQIEDGSFCYNVRTCYPVVAAEYSAVDNKGRAVSLDISTDGGATFRPFTSPATYAVRARVGFLIRVNAPISAVSRFRASTEVQVNSRVINGRLVSGENEILLKAVSDGSAKVNYQYRTRAKDICFDGAVPFGSIRGMEQHFVLLDPDKGPLRVWVEGLSSRAKLHCSEGLSATLRKGVVSISAKDRSERFGWVKVEDGDVRKTLTVMVCPGGRLVKAGVHFDEKGENASFGFDRVPAGKYAVLSLLRHPVDPDNPRVKTLEVRFGTAPAYMCGGQVNSFADYYKDILGKSGEPGVWRWDYPLDTQQYPFQGMEVLETDATDTISCVFNGMADYAEIGCFLIIPYPEREFCSMILKNLFSRNIRPWALRDD